MRSDVPRRKSLIVGGLTKTLARPHGQSLVEFILMVPLTITLLMGVIDFGFVFYAHVQVAAAAGEGARAGSLTLGNAQESSPSHADNDPARAAAILTAVPSAMGRLDTANAANFNEASDIAIAYNPPTPSAGATGARRGDEVIVTVTYRQPVIFQFIPGVSNSRVSVSSNARMRIQ